MASNKLLNKVFIFVIILLLFIVLTIISLGLFSRSSKFNTGADNKTDILAPTPDTSDKSGNNFPFSLSTEQINQSLMQNQEIIITPVKFNWPEEINSLLLKSGWKLIGLSHANDGGSVFYYYFKTKDVPALSLGYHWDMAGGRFESLSLNFIHPSRIGAWLIKYRSSFENSSISIESLMDCQGIIYETHPGVTECVEK